MCGSGTVGRGQGKALFGCARALSSGLCGPFRVQDNSSADAAGRVVATTGMRGMGKVQEAVVSGRWGGVR
jgi:hypothetical protein